jgi:hypothetical protein
VIRYWCRRCGIVRDLPDGPRPFCRHGYPLRLAAARMEPIPGWHPCASESEGAYAECQQGAA